MICLGSYFEPSLEIQLAKVAVVVDLFYKSHF